jgi:superfamily II DNA helicase RecQ
MSFHFFSIPAQGPEPAQSELNAFMAQARVLSVQRQLVADGASSYWAVCVETVSGPGPMAAALRAPPGRTTQVDYKQILSPLVFERYAALREWRKQVAQREAVPVYAVFSNEQLAAMAAGPAASKAELAQIEGVGPARLDKYGEQVLRQLQMLLNPIGQGGPLGGALACAPAPAAR